MGRQPFRDQVFDFDATVVTKLREAGAVLVAKLAMVELAGGFGYNNADASFTGPGPNAVEHGLLVAAARPPVPAPPRPPASSPFSIGSETSGSIVTPAAFSRRDGLRPTYGRVSRHGAMALCWTLDKLGPMCRERRGLRPRAGGDRGPGPDGRHVREPPVPRRAREREAEALEDRRHQGLVREGAARGAEELRGVAEGPRRRSRTSSRDVEFPDFPYGPAVSTIVAAEGASAFRDLVESGRAKELQGPERPLGRLRGLDDARRRLHPGHAPAGRR